MYEYGHIFSKERVINAIEISKEAYYYIYRKFPTNEELLNSLGEIFYDGFSDILVDEECDGCCEICERKGSNGFFTDDTNNGYLN